MFTLTSPVQHWDGTGGNGSALRHFEATGKKYPLVVKLGTITPAGADVYSYAEDEEDMVLDPKLPEHLAHWGINVLQVRRSTEIYFFLVSACSNLLISISISLFADGEDGKDHGRAPGREELVLRV